MILSFDFVKNTLYMAIDNISTKGKNYPICTVKINLDPNPDSSRGMRSLKPPKTSQHVSAAGQCLAEILFLSCFSSDKRLAWSWWLWGPDVQLCQDVVLPRQHMISIITSFVASSRPFFCVTHSNLVISSLSQWRPSSSPRTCPTSSLFSSL